MLKVADLLFLFAVFTRATSTYHRNEKVIHSHDAVACQFPSCSSHNTEYNQPTSRSKHSCLVPFSQWELSNNSTLTSLPLDRENTNFVRTVPNAVFSHVYPVPLNKIQLAALSDEALTNILDLDPCECSSNENCVQFLAGNWRHPSGMYFAHRYGGHQFGYWAGQLGDGRAVLLGEYVNKRGERWELQLKGSGKTPYSRQGDGRAVLRSSIRELLVSEALYHLGVPTTRAASLVVSEELTWRDQFYDGHPRLEKTAVVLRVSPSFFRIGSLEILHRNHEYDILKQLVDVVIEQHYTELLLLQGDDKYLEFFSAVVNLTAKMIARWQGIGFTHGVMNTDNLSLLGVTIDFGPFGFLEKYDPEFIPNTSDDEGRYRFQNQPSAGHFNLQRLLEAVLSLLSKKQVTMATESLSNYWSVFRDEYLTIMRSKLGITTRRESDEILITSLLNFMRTSQADYTMTLRELSETLVSTLFTGNNKLPGNLWALSKIHARHGQKWEEWLNAYSARVHPITSYGEGLRMTRMQATNPRYILRNWMAEESIRSAENGDFSKVHKLLRILRRPFESQAEAENAGYALPPPLWSHDLRVSCSS